MEHLIALLNALPQQPLILRLWQSGRELFHSNVLAYLLESPTYRGPLLQYLWGDDCDAFHVRALREHNSIDLLIVMLPIAPDAELHLETPGYWQWLEDNLAPAQRARLLAIESKFKSLPDEAQLQGYSERLHDKTLPIVKKPNWFRSQVLMGDAVPPNEPDAGNRPYLAADCKKVLLTPTAVNDIAVPLLINRSAESGDWARHHIEEIVLNDMWTSKTWEMLSELLLAQPGNENGLECSFVTSYAALLQTATELQAGIALHCSGDGSFAALDNLRTTAGYYRLRDFVEKWRYQFFLVFLRHAFENLLWHRDQLVRSKRGSELQHTVPHPHGAISIVSTLFSRTTGGVNVGLFRGGNQPFSLAVQLQGSKLKLMFAMAGGNDDGNRLAVSAALQTLAGLSENFAAVFGVNHIPEELGRYNQSVPLAFIPIREYPGQVIIHHVNGQLLYASATMWGEPHHPGWAEMSTESAAQQMAEITVDINSHWDAMAASMAPFL